MAQLGGRELEDPTGWSAPPPRSSLYYMHNYILDLESPASSVQRPCSNALGVCSGCKLASGRSTLARLGGRWAWRRSLAPLPPRQSRECSEKYPKVLRRARQKKKKGHNPPLLWALRVSDLAILPAPPAAAHTLPAPSPGKLRRRLGASLAAVSRPERPSESSLFSLEHHAQRRRIQQALGAVGGSARPRGTAAGQGRGLRKSSRGAAWVGGHRGRQQRRLGLGGVGRGCRQQEVPEAAQVRAMQEPRLRVAAQGPQALLHVAGLPVQEVQPDRRETARDGRAGESGRPGTGVQPRTLCIKVSPTWASCAGPGFGREVAVLAVSAERWAAAPSHAPAPGSEGLVSDLAGRAGRCVVCSAPQSQGSLTWPSGGKLQGSPLRGFPSSLESRIPLWLQSGRGRSPRETPGARNSASGGELRGWLCRGRLPGIFDP